MDYQEIKEFIRQNYPRSFVLPEKIGFFFDENMDQRVVDGLRRFDITVHTVEEHHLKGEKNDAAVLLKAIQLGCAMVTADKVDFVTIHTAVAELIEPEGVSHAGIVLISRPLSPGQLIGELKRIHDERIPFQMVNAPLYIPQRS